MSAAGVAPRLGRECLFFSDTLRTGSQSGPRPLEREMLSSSLSHFTGPGLGLSMKWGNRLCTYASVTSQSWRRG